MRSSPRTRGLTAAIAVAGLAGLAGLTACGSAVQKTGAPASAVTLLHLGAADINNAQLLDFASTLEATSDHRILVQIDQTTYFSETPGGEAKLAGDLGAGKVELGYLPSRDWAQAGAPGFAALQSPGLLTTTAQEEQLARSPLASELLGGLSAKGVVGLGLIPDEPRRLITRTPVLAAADLTGKQIRIGDNTQTAAMITALGGTAVQGLTAGQTVAKLDAGDLDGVETGPTPASQNNYNRSAPYLTSFALIPKFEVLAANQGFWKGLSSTDRQLVQQAAASSLNHSGLAVPAREAKQLELLCAGGAVIVRPSGSALKSLFAAAGKARPADATDTALITRIASAAGATAPQADAAAVPFSCPVASTAADAEARHRAAAQAALAGASAHPALLAGRYEVHVTAQDWSNGGAVGRDYDTDVTYTYTLSANGKLYETQKPDFPDQGPLHGTWRVNGNQINFLSGGAATSGADFNETVQWSYYKGVLNLKPVDVQDAPGAVIYSVPWRKTA